MPRPLSYASRSYGVRRQDDPTAAELLPIGSLLVAFSAMTTPFCTLPALFWIGGILAPAPGTTLSGFREALSNIATYAILGSPVLSLLAAILLRRGIGGRDAGELAFPWASAIDKRGRCVIVDSGNNRLQVLGGI